MPETPTVDAQPLRRTQSTGNIGARDSIHSSRARVSTSNNHPALGSHRTAGPSSPSNGATSPDEQPGPRAAPSQGTRLQWTESQTAEPQSLYARAKQFLGIGPNVSKTRKALISLVLTLSYSFLQVVAIITVLSIASVTPNPQDYSVKQINACGRPLVAWNCIWIGRLVLASGLSYWHFLRIRAANNAPPRGDSESTGGRSNNQNPRNNGANQRTHRERRSGGTSPGPSAPSNSEPTEPAPPYNPLYARLSLFASMLTLAWFLTAHILEYTSIQTCRLSSPLVWWLTFAVLCTMYFIVLEVILFGFLVFMVLPLIMLLYSIVLLCLGRHPLQNPHYIKPEIGKLPKSTVERIPLVIYIPPPPDDVGSPVSLPTAVHSYPPKPPPVVRKKRFAFISRRIKKAGPSENQVEDAVKPSQLVDNNEEAETWEDNWVKSEDYGFVRLDRNRAVCAICLMDFEEPTKKSTVPERNTEMNRRDDPALPREEVEFPVERITEEERNALPQLQDAGEGPQPLRLLKCHHVFHKTCIDPWLIDVSGRCPVCQRPVEIDDVEPKKPKRGRRS